MHRQHLLYILFACLLVRSFQLSSGLSIDDFQIECYSNGFQVSLSKQYAVQNGIHEFRLKANSCISVDNTTHLIVSSTNNYCGTTKRKSNNGYVYSNELLHVMNNIENNGRLKPKCPYLDVKVSCWYPLLFTAHARRKRDISNQVVGSVLKVKRCKHLIGHGKYRGEVATKQQVSSRIGIVAKPKIITCPLLIGVGEALGDDRILTSATVQHRVGIRVKSPQKSQYLCQPLRQQGSFHTKLKLFADQSFGEEFNSNNDDNNYNDEKKRRIDWFQDVYYEASMLPMHENLRVVLTRCYATPSPDPSDELQYVYISQGCPIDPTVKFYPSKSGSARFSITAFRFRNSKSLSFYTHCDLIICDKNDPSSQCQIKCNDVEVQGKSRRRRSVIEGCIQKTRLRRMKSLYKKFMMKSRYENSPVPGIHRSFVVPGMDRAFVGNVRDADVNIYLEIPPKMRENHKGNPVQAIILGTRERNILVKVQTTKNDTIFMIRECFYGKSLLVKNGCTTNEGLNHVELTSTTLLFKLGSFHRIKKFVNYELRCYIQVCGPENYDQCKTSCKHSRKRRNTNRAQGDVVNVFCFSNHMMVTVQKFSADSRQLQLIDPQCIANQNETHFILKTGLNDCGTTYTTKDGLRYYNNEITEKVDTELPVIRSPSLKRAVRCAYNTRTVSEAVKIKLGMQTLKGKAAGRYQVQIDMYQDSKYTTKAVSGFAEVNETSDMFFEVSITNEQFNKNLALHLDACLGYPMHRTDPRQMYTFIEDGCAIDDTVMFYKTAPSAKTRFSIKPFKFSGPDSNIVINCYVTACNASDLESKCSKGCQQN